MGLFATLAEALSNASTLTGYARVLFGHKKLPLSGSPRRIVLFPASGKLEGPADRRALADEITVMAAHIWGRDEDDVQDLTARLFQALDEQAVGSAAGAGLRWVYEPGTVEWETVGDTSQQGESKVVQFSIAIALNRVVGRTGTVEATQIEGSPDTGTISILPDP